MLPTGSFCVASSQSCDSALLLIDAGIQLQNCQDLFFCRGLLAGGKTTRDFLRDWGGRALQRLVCHRPPKCNCRLSCLPSKMLDRCKGRTPTQNSRYSFCAVRDSQHKRRGEQASEHSTRFVHFIAKHCLQHKPENQAPWAERNPMCKRALVKLSGLRRLTWKSVCQRAFSA